MDRTPEEKRRLGELFPGLLWQQPKHEGKKVQTEKGKSMTDSLHMKHEKKKQSNTNQGKGTIKLEPSKNKTCQPDS